MKATLRTKPRDRRSPRSARPAAKPFALRTILVSTDFSEPSLNALPTACALAKKFGASLHLVHVNDLATQEPLLAPTLDLAGDYRHKLRRRLQAIGAQCGVPVAPANCHLRSGHADSEICRQARRLHASLIVLSTHGYSGLKHLMLGSTAERVLRRAPCPVLVMRGAKSAGIRIRKIVVPTDFSPPASAALEYAIGFAKFFGAHLTIINAIYPHYYATNPELSLYDYGILFEDACAEAKKQMAKLVRTTSFRGVPFRALTETGHPVISIAGTADRDHADLIFISTHGRTGLKRAFVGSVAEQVTRYAKCPVLVLPRGNASTAA